ncbi:MAG: hypothetical protein ACPG7F_09395 [Aggregatilineales bacterium]
MDRHTLARFLRTIPQSNEDAKSLTTLNIAPNVPESLHMLHGYAMMLHTLGVVTFDPDTQCIQARSQTAKYTLMSLAAYVEFDLRLIEDWKTRGIYPDGESPVQNGATFLHALETQRYALMHDDAAPSRHERVAQVLIKRINPETGDHELLFQYDKNASQYQFIGGRYKPEDGDLRTTMLREIEEELEDGALQYPRDYDLKLLAEKLKPPTVLSPTFGALTSYQFDIYLMTNLKRDLRLQSDDLWVPIEQIQAGFVRKPDGTESYFDRLDIYQEIEAMLPDGWASLESSFVE